LNESRRTVAQIDRDNSLHTETEMRNGTEAAPNQTHRPGVMEIETDYILGGINND